jgi:hypothetical protein
MTWDDIARDHQHTYHRDVIYFEDPAERSYLFRIVREHFPTLSRASVERAFKACCAIIPEPRPSDWFFDCLKSELPED